MKLDLALLATLARMLLQRVCSRVSKLVTAVDVLVVPILPSAICPRPVRLSLAGHSSVPSVISTIIFFQPVLWAVSYSRGWPLFAVKGPFGDRTRQPQIIPIWTWEPPASRGHMLLIVLATV